MMMTFVVLIMAAAMVYQNHIFAKIDEQRRQTAADCEEARVRWSMRCEALSKRYVNLRRQIARLENKTRRRRAALTRLQKAIERRNKEARESSST